VKADSVEYVKSKRTLRQNDSLHLYFSLLSQELNAGGWDMKKVIRQEVDIPWSPQTVKEYLWRPLQKAQLDKKSTTELETTDIDLIYDTLNRVIGERTGVFIPFPSLDSMINQSQC